MARLIWVAWILMGAVYATMLLWSLPHLMHIAGGLPMFDMRPGGYSFDEAVAVLSALGSDGRAFYTTVQHRLDLVFPALEALALVLTFPLLFSRVLALPLMGVSVLAAVFDWFENAAVSVLLRADLAAITPDMVTTANRWTILKSVTVSVAMTALLIGLLMALWQRLRRHR